MRSNPLLLGSVIKIHENVFMVTLWQGQKVSLYGINNVLYMTPAFVITHLCPPSSAGKPLSLALPGGSLTVGWLGACLLITQGCRVWLINHLCPNPPQPPPPVLLFSSVSPGRLLISTLPCACFQSEPRHADLSRITTGQMRVWRYCAFVFHSLSKVIMYSELCSEK